MNRVRTAILILAIAAIAAIGVLRAQTPAAPPSSSAASYNATAQAANISAKVFYTVPAGNAMAAQSVTQSGNPPLQGKYLFSCYVVETTAATTSSTMPTCDVAFTDADSATAESATAVTSTSSGNAAGTYSSGTLVIDPAAGSNVSVSTASYASSGTTGMAYSVHASLEYIGN